jgi:hypothetical protein
MKAVDILARLDRPQDTIRAHMTGQGELNEDAVDTLVIVQLANELHHLLLGRRLRQIAVNRSQSGLDRSLGFRLYINLAGWVLADQDHGKRRDQVLRGFQVLRVTSDTRVQQFGDGFAIY